MEQTKSFKWTNFLYLLLLIPLVFVFAACGGNPDTTKQLKTEAACNTNGDFAGDGKQSNVVAFRESLSDEITTSSGYRYTVKLSVNNLDDEDAAAVDALYINAIIKGDLSNKDSNVEIAMTLKEDMAAVMNTMTGLFGDQDPTAGEESADEEETVIEETVFYKGGKLYGTDEKGNKQFIKVEASALFDMLLGAGDDSIPMSMDDFLAFTNIEDVIDLVSDSSIDAQAAFNVFKDGNNYKIMAQNGFTVEGQTINADATLFVNCDEKGNVVAIKLVYELNLKNIIEQIVSGMLSGSMTAQQIEEYLVTMNIPNYVVSSEFIMEAFDGNITFPDFSGYKETTVDALKA